VKAAGIAVGLAVAVTLGLGVRAPIAASRATRMQGAVVLRPRDPAGLQRFIAAVSDDRSASYGRYLRPGEFAAHFGPTTAAVAAITAQLRARGLRVGPVSDGRMLIPFSGSTAAVSAMARPRGARHALVAGLSGPVAAVVGPGVTTHTAPAGVAHPIPSQVPRHRAARSVSLSHPAGSPRACAAARVASIGADGLTDDQIAHAYGAFGLYAAGDRGAGQRIAIYENEPFLRSDIRTFDTCYFGARQASAMQRRLHVVAVDGGQPTGPGTGEASLDVEDVSALAPGATIDVYEGPYTGANPTDYDSLNEYAAIVNADRDRVVSTSWGLCEQSVQNGQPGIQQAENVLFQQAAAQGQTVFSAAGDNGSDDCNTNEKPTPVKGQNPVSVDDPSSQPYVVAVGGTAIDDARQPPVEQAWNGGPRGGSGGGGISQSWQMPAWQRTSRVPGIAFPGGADYRDANAVQRAFGYPPGFCRTTAAGATTTTGAAGPVACRLLPDVSAEADPFTGSISVYSRSYAGTSFSKDGWTTTGGTSSSAPLWAATLALVNASPPCAAATSTRAGVGFVAPQLYALASDPVRYRSSFHDITAGNNDVNGLAGTRLFPARRGYDMATGLGSPQLTGAGGTAGLAYYLCASARAPRPVVTRLSPAVGDVAGGQHVTITGSGFGRGVSSVQVGTRRLSSFRVISPTSIVITLPPARELVAPAAPAPQDGAGPANVIVVSRDGQASTSGPASTFDYIDSSPTGSIATIDAIAPSGGRQDASRPVTILGSGMRGATQVTFGGVPARSIRVAGRGRIVATPPVYSPATACAPLPTTIAYRGETAANDICQVAVRVINPYGASATDRIPAPYEGAIATDALGDIKLPAGCGCEGVTAPDEYDYVPAPRITSVSTSAGPASLASEAGGTVITIHGRGLNPLVLDWADFGAPGRAASQVIDYAYLSGTKIQIKAPPSRRTVDRTRVRVSVKTLAGQSPAAHAIYAGVPQITSVVSVRDRRRLHGVSGAPDTGGTPIRITGRGLAGQLAGPLEFVAPRGLSAGTEYAYRVSGAAAVETTTVAQTPARVDVLACTVTGCSDPGRQDRLWLYAPGDPSVRSVTPAVGAAAGGTHTTVAGANLGCPLGVWFGRRAALSFRPGTAALDCGATEFLRAASPSGAPGSRVPVSVQTVESYFTGHGRGSTIARFDYRH
jgi:pro-kumamolisin-like protein/subtilase family protein/IPT/TIG domain-containing protein